MRGRDKKGEFFVKKYLATCGIKEAGKGSATKPNRLTSPLTTTLKK